MTIAESFIQFLEDQGIATFGQDLYLRKVPNSYNTTKDVYWVIPSGGQPLSKLKTGEILKQYSFLIYFRSMKVKIVEEKTFELEELLNCSGCVSLEGFDVVSIDVNRYASDEDIDLEDREVGLVQVNINTYKNIC